MLVPILTVVLNKLFHQGSVHDRISKGCDHAVKEEQACWEELDDYRPITLLNTAEDFGQNPDGVFNSISIRCAREWRA